jgi:hypothetical protein
MSFVAKIVICVGLLVQPEAATTAMQTATASIFSAFALDLLVSRNIIAVLSS